MSSAWVQINLQTNCSQSNTSKNEQLTNKIALHIDRVLMLVCLMKDHCFRSLQLDEDQAIH